MTGVNYVTDENGIKTALFIDLSHLRKTKKSDTKYREFLEDLEDMISIELGKDEKSRPYDDFIKEILDK